MLKDILEVLSPTNLTFLLNGLGLTLYLSAIIIVLSTLLGTILAVMRNGKNPLLRWIASIYIEFVRNVPNLLWIFTIFLVFQLKSTQAGLTAFTVFTSAALAEIIRGGLNSIDTGQTEAGLSQGFSQFQILIYIILPQAIRKMLPSIISQFVTVIKVHQSPLLCYRPPRALWCQPDSNGTQLRDDSCLHPLRDHCTRLLCHQLCHL